MKNVFGISTYSLLTLSNYYIIFSNLIFSWYVHFLKEKLERVHLFIIIATIYEVDDNPCNQAKQPITKNSVSFRLGSCVDFKKPSLTHTHTFTTEAIAGKRLHSRRFTHARAAHSMLKHTLTHTHTNKHVLARTHARTHALGLFVRISCFWNRS